MCFIDTLFGDPVELSFCSAFEFYTQKKVRSPGQARVRKPSDWCGTDYHQPLEVGRRYRNESICEHANASLIGIHPSEVLASCTIAGLVLGWNIEHHFSPVCLADLSSIQYQVYWRVAPIIYRLAALLPSPCLPTTSSRNALDSLSH